MQHPVFFQILLPLHPSPCLSSHPPSTHPLLSLHPPPSPLLLPTPFASAPPPSPGSLRPTRDATPRVAGSRRFSGVMHRKPHWLGPRGSKPLLRDRLMAASAAASLLSFGAGAKGFSFYRISEAYVIMLCRDGGSISSNVT